MIIEIGTKLFLILRKITIRIIKSNKNTNTDNECNNNNNNNKNSNSNIYDIYNYSNNNIFQKSSRPLNG